MPCNNGKCDKPPCQGSTCAIGTTCCEAECCTAGQLCCQVNAGASRVACFAATDKGTCPLGCAQSEKLTDIDHFGLNARALLTKAMNQTSDPCKYNTSPAGGCSTDYADVSRRCGKVYREHATVALLSLARAGRPHRSRHADRERDARVATTFRSEEIRASARGKRG